MTTACKSPSEILGAPIDLPCGVTIKNRFLKSAMSEGIADNNHDPRPDHARLYQTFADGGIGVALTGNVMIDQRALGEPGNVVLEDDHAMTKFKAWASAATHDDTHLWMQINHPGKQQPKGISTQQAVAPSAIGLEGTGMKNAFGIPRELSGDEIEDIITRFGRTAGLAKQAGFTGVQIHGAHGYLVSQFLSPRHNQRTDEWGGSAQNRRRFVLQVYQSMRSAVGDDFPVSIKLNSADFMRGGFTDEESLDVIAELDKAGIDLIEISGGSYESPEMFTSKKSTRGREAFFMDFAEKARKRVKVPLAVTGGFRSARGMARAVESGAVDLVGLARPLCIDPDLPNKILAGADYEAPMRKLSTGVAALDKMGMVEITWYEQQLARMGRGKSPKMDMTVWGAATRTMLSNGLKAFQQRRA